MTFSTPLTFAALSATAFALFPATNAVTEPPSFWAATTAEREEAFKLPSLCSKIANEDNNLASSRRWDVEKRCKSLVWALNCLKTVLPVTDAMASSTIDRTNTRNRKIKQCKDEN